MSSGLAAILPLEVKLQSLFLEPGWGMPSFTRSISKILYFDFILPSAGKGDLTQAHQTLESTSMMSLLRKAALFLDLTKASLGVDALGTAFEALLSKWVIQQKPRGLLMTEVTKAESQDPG